MTDKIAPTNNNPDTKDDPTNPLALKSKVELAGRSLISRLRQIADPPGKRTGWFAKLTDRQLVEVYFRLKAGQTLYRTAQVCQNDWGYQKASPVKNLIPPIREFRNKVLGALELEKLEPVPGEQKSKKPKNTHLAVRAEKIKEKLDAMETMAWAIQSQKERLEVLFTREKQSLPFKFTDKAVETMANMIEKYVELQIKLGVLDSRPSEYNVHIKTAFDGIMQHVLPPGTQMPTVALTFLDKCEKAALTLSPGPDGAFSLKKGPDEEDLEYEAGEEAGEEDWEEDEEE